mmetsp:Transcript_60706/g.130387  ORF Transcript_60706/g.130387 Transcript_60706/m.130387 type:complete len:502 (+) Transcript_60706:47-1552(+)
MALSAEYGSMLDGMRAMFAKGKTKDLAWRRQQLEQCHRMIAENHEAITAATRADLGGSKIRGVAELAAAGAADHALDCLDEWTREKWVGGWFHREYVRPEPKGVILIISPWNFPFNLCLHPMVEAIAAGNCVVIKPSELNNKCSPLIESLISKYLDPECVKVVQGAIPETSALLEQRWDHIMYTGNGAVGRIIMQAAAKHLTPVTLELGGKSPVIVDETANLDVACERVAMAKWLNCGQICVAPDYALVHESKMQEFMDRSKACLKKCYGDNPQASAEFGHIINERHVDRVSKLIETSKGKVVCGGAEGIIKKDLYVPPTIIEKPSLDEPLMQEEIFGPVLPVLPFKDLEEALSMVNGKETPLAMYIYSQSSGNIEKALMTAGSGGTCVNSSLEHLTGENMPFGGKGPSGMGAYHGKYGFDEFSHHRAVLRKSTLPGFRGTAFPLPSADTPTPDFVYGIAAKMSIGFLPRPLKAFLRTWRPRVMRLATLAVLGYVVYAILL